jgi:hypothetical protein
MVILPEDFKLVPNYQSSHLALIRGAQNKLVTARALSKFKFSIPFFHHDPNFSILVQVRWVNFHPHLHFPAKSIRCSIRPAISFLLGYWIEE